jgi:transcriptional regulator with XRE-family HTH domain
MPKEITKKATAKRKPKNGRPTKYDAKYCQEMVKFFDVDATRIVEDMRRDGSTTERRVANAMPTFAKFARKIGVSRDTLNEWTRKHAEFSDSYKRCKELQEEFLINVGLAGVTSASFVIFTMKNVCGWRDEKDLKIKAQKEQELNDAELDEAIFG